MEDRRIKSHIKRQQSFGKTNWFKVQSQPPKIDKENPELVGKVKFSKPEEPAKDRNPSKTDGRFSITHYEYQKITDTPAAAATSSQSISRRA